MELGVETNNMKCDDFNSVPGCHHLQGEPGCHVLLNTSIPFRQAEMMRVADRTRPKCPAVVKDWFHKVSMLFH